VSSSTAKQRFIVKTSVTTFEFLFRFLCPRFKQPVVRKALYHLIIIVLLGIERSGYAVAKFWLISLLDKPTFNECCYMLNTFFSCKNGHFLTIIIHNSLLIKCHEVNSTFLFAFRLLRFLSNYLLRSLISTLKSKIS
jgi:hypothetical protein